jgi:hypothetical protein
MTASAMTYVLPENRMPEAEVSLRLAFYLLKPPHCGGDVEVAIDGAQVKVHGKQVFPLAAFLADAGWKQIEQKGKNNWQGQYEQNGRRLKVHAKSGSGDVVATVGDRRVWAECKGGPLIKKRGSPEYPILRGALGQIITVEKETVKDCVLVVAVPATDAFCRLADKWQNAPLVVRSKIQIALVSRDGYVEGLKLD